LGVGKQMIETVAQHHRQHIKDDLTVARGTKAISGKEFAFSEG